MHSRRPQNSTAGNEGYKIATSNPRWCSRHHYSARWTFGECPGVSPKLLRHTDPPGARLHNPHTPAQRTNRARQLGHEAEYPHFSRLSYLVLTPLELGARGGQVTASLGKKGCPMVGTHFHTLPLFPGSAPPELVISAPSKPT